MKFLKECGLLLLALLLLALVIGEWRVGVPLVVLLFSIAYWAEREVQKGP